MRAPEALERICEPPLSHELGAELELTHRASRGLARRALLLFWHSTNLRHAEAAPGFAPFRTKFVSALLVR
jgi:hypothetical protein